MSGRPEAAIPPIKSVLWNPTGQESARYYDDLPSTTHHTGPAGCTVALGQTCEHGWMFLPCAPDRLSQEYPHLGEAAPHRVSPASRFERFELEAWKMRIRVLLQCSPVVLDELTSMAIAAMLSGANAYRQGQPSSAMDGIPENALADWRAGWNAAEAAHRRAWPTGVLTNEQA